MALPPDTAESFVREVDENLRQDQMRQMAVTTIPLGRPGTPEEAASAMLFLASPLSNYVSGQILEVTGGGEL